MRLIDADAFKKVIRDKLPLGLFMKRTIPSAMKAMGELVEEVDQAPTVDQWHYPSKGELPDDNEIVLLSIKGRVWKRMEFGQWNGQFFVANDSDYSVSEIIAWMPLPEPPKEEA